MSRCVPVQTNVNTNTTFFLPAGAPVPPPPPPGTGYSTITAADFISTNNLVVSSINNFTPAIHNGLSSVTAANSITSSNAFVSSVNGAAYTPVTNLVVSTLFVIFGGNLSTPQITANSIAGQPYPPPQNPDFVVSTLTAATNISTVLAEINQVNNAPFISTLSTLTIPSDLVVSTFTASTITVPQLSLSNVSTGSLVFTGISTPTVSTTSINSIAAPPKFYPGYIYGGGSGPVALGVSTSVDILANYGPEIMSTLLPSYTVVGTTALLGFPSSIPGIIPTGISSFVITAPAGVGIGSPWRYNTLLISNSKPVV